jgi:hypothetical protein
VDTLTFIVEMTKALAWPGGAVGVTVLLRKPLRLLLEGLRLKHLKVAGVEAEFSREWAEQVQQVVAELPALPAETKPAQPKFLDTFGAVVEDASPLTTIVTTWVEIERRVREAVKGTPAGGDKVPFGKMLDVLVKTGKVTPATAEGLRGLQQLRNLAVHAPHDEALAARVPQFRAMSAAMLWSLEHDLNREPKAPKPGEEP